MSTPTVTTKQIIESIRSLVDHFRDELSGSRQATRTQMVRFLARSLDVGEPTARRLFDDLRDAGVIVRGDERLDDEQLPDRDGQSWSIDVADSTEAIVRTEPDDTPLVVEESEPQALDLLRRAILQRASDIHLDPFDDEVEVRFRIDGRLEHYCRLSENIGEKLMSQLKVLADLDPTEPFHSQEGRLNLPVSLSDYDVRITSTPVVAGDAVALRLLRRNQIIRPLDTLGFTGASSDRVDQLLELCEGLVLATGPSGAGKTTTLYSLVKAFDDGHRNIVTIEDPVEYFLPEFLQVQVDVKHQRTLAAGVRTALRMDPDIILLGEIRDAETAVAAMQAASCGKFVFCTFHTRDSASVVTRLRDMGVDDRSLASNLRAVFSQRLVRRLCSECEQSRSVEPHEKELFDSHAVALPDFVPRAVGCDACHHTGYHERIAVFEIALVTPQIAEAIEAGKAERDVRRLFIESGVRSLVSDGLHKVRDGVTTLEEVQSMTWLNPGE